MGAVFSSCRSSRFITSDNDLADANEHSGTASSKQRDPTESLNRTLQEHQAAQKEYEYLTKTTGLDIDIIRYLHARFTAIDVLINEDKNISVREFAKAIGMPHAALLVQRLFSVMDKAGMDQINLRNFVTTLAHLDVSSPLSDKISLTFQLFDLNSDGVVDEREMAGLMRSAYGLMLEGDPMAGLDDECSDTVPENEIIHLTSDHMTEIVRHTFDIILSGQLTDADSDSTDRSNRTVTLKQYQCYCTQNPRVLAPFSIDLREWVDMQSEIKSTLRAGKTDRSLHHGPAASQTSPKKSGIGSMFSPRTQRVLSINCPDQMSLSMSDLEKAKKAQKG